MKPSTLKKFTELLKDVKSSGKSLKTYCKDNELSYHHIINTFVQIRKKSNKDTRKLLKLYDEVTAGQGKAFHYDVSYERNKEGSIECYYVTILSKEKEPTIVPLTRSDAEILFGLYTYYGGNITARNVANELPKLTLYEVKRIFKAFQLTKDSLWAPPHLVEELTTEELNTYRFNLKERAAFKYADAKQERDYKNLVNKLASKIIKLEDKNIALEGLILKGIIPAKFHNISNSIQSSSTYVLYLSDLHIGSYNEKYGYIQLENYDREEIMRRLSKVIDFVSTKKYDRIVVVNLGDSVDSFNRHTTRGGHELPSIVSNKEQSQLYLEIMLGFFQTLRNYCPVINYCCVGEDNHSGDWGWINNVALASKLEAMGIQSHISNNPIDKLDINNISIIYLHGKDIHNQFKGFPLVLDDKTVNWFNNYFLTSRVKLKDKVCVVKGDLHRPAFTTCNTFDYYSCPSVYGSSQYIVANFGKTNWGIMYMEIDSNNNILTGIIKD